MKLGGRQNTALDRNPMRGCTMGQTAAFYSRRFQAWREGASHKRWQTPVLGPCHQGSRPEPVLLFQAWHRGKILVGRQQRAIVAKRGYCHECVNRLQLPAPAS